MADYARVPTTATLNIRPFKAYISDEKLEEFKKLLELSPIGPAVYENTSVGRTYGITRDWLVHAKDVWLNDFDWRKHEDRINSYPNFKAEVKDSQGNTIDVQFLALFSERADAVPLAFFHGWPSSICEFMDILDLLKQRYSPAELPYHVIVPSLPGYAYSSGLPLDKDYGIDVAAGAMHSLMMGLGFGSGYLVQGGDLGSFISRILVMTHDECKGMHLNTMVPPSPDDLEGHSTDKQEERALQKANEFTDTSFGFFLEQGTRPSTLGLVLSSSPLALLSWVGEKKLEWTDEDPPLEKILEGVTLYYLTDTISRSFYHNRALGGRATDDPRIARLSVITGFQPMKLPFIEKPCGYSLFLNEIVPGPKSWAMKICNLISFNQHDGGGHFAPMEKPKELLDDVEAFIETWKRVSFTM